MPIGHALEHWPKEPAAWSAPLFEGKISAQVITTTLGDRTLSFLPFLIIEHWPSEK